MHLYLVSCHMVRHTSFLSLPVIPECFHCSFPFYQWMMTELLGGERCTVGKEKSMQSFADTWFWTGCKLHGNCLCYRGMSSHSYGCDTLCRISLFLKLLWDTNDVFISHLGIWLDAYINKPVCLWDINCRQSSVSNVFSVDTNHTICVTIGRKA